MVTIQVNEKTRAGKAILELVKLFSNKEKGVKIIEPEEDTYPISKNIPNEETLKVFEENEKGRKKDLKEIDCVDALFEDF